jgi:hypothetical protein
MADNRKNLGAQDRARINLKEAQEVRYWTGKFGCTEDQLRATVTMVGASADAVARELGN